MTDNDRLQGFSSEFPSLLAHLNQKWGVGLETYVQITTVGKCKMPPHDIDTGFEAVLIPGWRPPAVVIKDDPPEPVEDEPKKEKPKTKK